MPKNAAKKSSGSGCDRDGRDGRDGRDVRDPSLSTHSPSDGDSADSSDSRTSSETSSWSTSSQPSVAKRRRAKKTQFCLTVKEEQLMLDFLVENAILWDTKKTDYQSVDRSAKLWEDQARTMGKTVEHLRGWFKPLRDIHIRLSKKESGDRSPELTQREQWVKANLSFLKNLVTHYEPANRVKASTAAHSGDLEAAEAVCGDTVVDDHTPSTVHSSCSQRLGKRSQDDDQLLQSLQKREHEFGELIKGLTQTQPSTATIAFANYVRDSLVIMSKSKFRKARSCINTILTELMDEDLDEREPHSVPMFPAPAYVRLDSAPATNTPTAWEIYQPPPFVWRRKAPAATVLSSQAADYVDQEKQLQPQYQQQRPQYPRMTLSPPQPPPQPRPQMRQQLRSASVPATLGLAQVPSGLDSNSQSTSNISGLSGMVSLSSFFGAVSSPSEEWKTPPSSAMN